MKPWLTNPAPQAEAFAAALSSSVPSIETARLVLRPCKLSDWPVLEPIWTTDQARFIGGPMTAEDAWLDFNQCLSSWFLRGTGALAITTHDSDTPLGIVVIMHEYGDPELELGWLITKDAEGNGYATEAAEALLDWTFRQLGVTQMVSYVHANNVKSANLATRLGGVLRPEGHPAWDNCLVFEHRRPTKGAEK